jgi:hypothetical protein
MAGWIKLHRELLEKAIWTTSTVEQRLVLITLLTMANHKESEWEWNGKKFKALPGQMVTSAASIAKKCGDGVTRQNIRSALVRFKKYEFLTMESTKTGMLITIVNWDVYQGNDDEPNQEPNQRPTKTQPTPNQRPTTNKNDNNKKNERMKEETLSSFDLFWSFYPKKKAKGDAVKAWLKLKITDELLQTILDAVKRQAKSYDWTKNNGQFIPNAATWLNGGRWEDEVKDYTPNTPTKPRIGDDIPD